MAWAVSILTPTSRRRDVGLIHRLVGLGFDGDLDLGVVFEHVVDGLDQSIDRDLAVLGLANVRAFAREPEDNQLRVERHGDVDGPAAAVFGILAALGVV